MNYEKSLKYDIETLRKSPAVPKHIKLYGFFYEINSGKLTEVVRWGVAIAINGLIILSFFSSMFRALPSLKDPGRWANPGFRSFPENRLLPLQIDRHID